MEDFLHLFASLRSMNFSVYVDESGSHSDAPVLCLAGYLFSLQALAPFSGEWQSFLDRYQLPYFHMVDCAQGTGAFKLRSKEERGMAIREVVEIIQAHTLFG